MGAVATWEVDDGAPKVKIALEGTFLRSAVMELMKAKAEEDEVGYSAPEARLEC